VNATAPSGFQPKGVREGRAAHIAAKATESVLDRNGCWTSPGSQAARRYRATRNRRDPTCAATSGEIRAYKAGGFWRFVVYYCSAVYICVNISTDADRLRESEVVGVCRARSCLHKKLRTGRCLARRRLYARCCESSVRSQSIGFLKRTARPRAALFRHSGILRRLRKGRVRAQWR